MKKETRVDSIIANFKNNKWLSLFIIFAIIIISFGTTLDAVTKIKKLFTTSMSNQDNAVDRAWKLVDKNNPKEIIQFINLNKKNTDLVILAKTTLGKMNISKYILMNDASKLWERKNDLNINSLFLYEEAKNYCENLELAGFTGWRLPFPSEKIKLDHKYYPELATTLTSRGDYWAEGEWNKETSEYSIELTTYYGKHHEYSMEMGEAFTPNALKKLKPKGHARCVRNGNLFYGYYINNNNHIENLN